MQTPTEPAPLAVTADPALRDELGRLAAAAGVVLDPVPVAGALGRWSGAPLVLVGADRVGEVAALLPERRSGVLVVGWSGQPDAVFRSALELGAERVLELPAATEAVTDALTDLGETVSGPTPVLGVLAGHGGAGATVLACALGQQSARTAPTLVVDLDPCGPGADRVLGLDGAPGVRWDDLAASVGRLGARSLREAVPRRDGVGVLAWSAGAPSGLRPPLVREAMSAATRGHATVVVDLPRGAEPAREEVLARCRLVALVVRPSATAVVAAARVAATLPDPHRLGVVVREARGTAVDPRRVAAAVGAPLLAAMPDQRGLAEALGLGLGPARATRGPLARACREVLSALAGAAA